MSLDGFIAGPNGEYDWIVTDPDIDVAEMMAQHDTCLIGRKTFEVMRRMFMPCVPGAPIDELLISRDYRSCLPGGFGALVSASGVCL